MDSQSPNVVQQANELNEQQREELYNAAVAVAKNAYCPSSKFQVGAALLTESDTIFTGCNVENASYGLTMCAERTAIGKAVSEGQKEFKAIAIVGNKKGEPPQFVTPCGACRQVMMEFTINKNFSVYSFKSNNNECKKYLLGDLLPYAFDSSSLQ